jgi:A/G-specific adenine glycosylase
MDDFIRTIWTHYKKYGRDLPWRHDITPYRIVVSEIMLQQTQASRVAKKFDSLLARFPDWKYLANASTMDVLKEWQGLVYNRRGLNLQRIAQAVMVNGGKDKNGILPQTHAELLDLPGIGPNTAGSILAFAWNLPHPFIETNIRAVFLQLFF